MKHTYTLTARPGRAHWFRNIITYQETFPTLRAALETRALILSENPGYDIEITDERGQVIA